MLSFHGKQETKDKYLNRVIAHREADAIIQGTGWENGKGCAVGCTLENYDHSRYPTELGLPEWLAHLEDVIFEKLPKEEAMLWPERFLSAIPIGVDVGNVRHKLSILRLDRLIEIQKKLSEKEISLKNIFDQVISAIEIVKRCHEAELNNSYCDWSAESAESAAWSARSAASAAWSVASAASAARSAAWSVASAESAARSAAWSVASAASAAWSARSAASAESAAWSVASAASAESAESAASAAWSAASAESAASAAWSAASAESAARSAAWKQESEDLLRLLRECK